MTNDPAPKRFTEAELRALREYAQIEMIDVAMEMFEVLAAGFDGLPERCTADLEIQQRIRDELASLTASIAAISKSKARKIQNGEGY